MKTRTTTACLLAMALGLGIDFARTREQTITQLRAGFEEVGRRGLALDGVPRNQWRLMPDPYDAALPLLKTDPAVLDSAIGVALHEGKIEERVGALGIYGLAVRHRVFRVNHQYQTLLLELLKQDDLQRASYTGGILAGLALSPSRDAVLAHLAALDRVKAQEVRERILFSVADLVRMELPVDSQTSPLAKERIFTEFTEWLGRNKDRIRFNKDGDPYLAGGEAREAKIELTPEDRSRIRKDPTCVLKLVRGMMAGEAEGLAELNRRCGEALQGAEGAAAFSKALQEAGQGSQPSLDTQTGMAMVRGSYPTMDAVQLAIAYVAAYEANPEARKLARETLDDLGTSEMARVLKGEPKEVRKKAMALAEEIDKEKGED